MSHDEPEEPRHTPVLVDEVLELLQVKPGGLYIDCTLGEGGHSLAILTAAADARLLGIDLDTNALAAARKRLSAYSDNTVFAQGNFADLESISKRHGHVGADGVLLDLGLSSLQVDTGSRGFSFRQEARLDMRFDPTQEFTADQVVNEYEEVALADIIYRMGEEPKSRRVARSIVRSRPIATTTELADVVANAVGRSGRSRIHPATRTFQAIRMYVNRELENLSRGLEQAIDVLAIGGRVAVISYHSLEDRLVKGFFRRESSDCICPPETPVCVCDHTARVKRVTRRIVRSGPAEVASNPRSRSAKMRVAERI